MTKTGKKSLCAFKLLLNNIVCKLLSFMPLILITILFCLISVIAYNVYSKLKERNLIEQVTPITRGEESELMVVLKLLKMGIDPKAIFHDLYIRKPNGEYTQIDVAVATKTGIIVFEVKDYSGWIFGDEYQRYWTQLLAYGKEKHRFYNPIMQNAGHIKTIRHSLPYNPGIPIYSVIVFFGNCELKNVTCNADNTYVIYSDSIKWVVSKILMQPNANLGNKYEIMRLFNESVQNGNNPMIVSSQIRSAQYYGRNRPQSSYTISFKSLFRFGGFYKRRRF